MQRLKPHERHLLGLYEQAVQQMEPLDRMVFLALVVDDLSMDAVVEHLAMSRDAVEHALVRCLDVLESLISVEDLV